MSEAVIRQMRAYYKANQQAFHRDYKRILVRKIKMLEAIFGAEQVMDEDYVRIFNRSVYAEYGLMTLMEFVEELKFECLCERMRQKRLQQERDYDGAWIE